MGIDIKAVKEEVEARGGRETERRASPKNRKPNEPKLVLDPPIRLPVEWAKRVMPLTPKRASRTGHAAERVSPLLQKTIDGVPLDAEWYFTAVAFSRGEASAFVNPIKYGAIGHDVEVAYFRIPNKNDFRPREDGEYAICIRRHP